MSTKFLSETNAICRIRGYIVISLSIFGASFVFQVVTYEEGESLAKEYNIHFFETSAKQDLNVEKSFITIATDVKDRLIADGGSTGPRGKSLAPAPQARKGCC